MPAFNVPFELLMLTRSLIIRVVWSTRVGDVVDCTGEIPGWECGEPDRAFAASFNLADFAFGHVAYDVRRYRRARCEVV